MRNSMFYCGLFYGRKRIAWLMPNNNYDVEHFIIEVYSTISIIFK